VTLLKSHFPSLAASFVVGGIVVALEGTPLQAIIAAIATGSGSLATSALIIQSADDRQKALLLEQKTLLLENDRLKQALPFRAELEDLQQRRDLLQENILEQKHIEEELNSRIQGIKQDFPNLDELERRQQKLSELKTYINQAQGQLNTIQQQIHEKEKQRDHLQDISNQFLQKQAAVQELKEQLQVLNQQATELELFRSTYDALQREATQLETKKQQLQVEIPRIEQERDRLLAEILTEEAKAQEVDNLRIEIIKLKGELRNKVSELNSFKREIDSLELEKNELEIDIQTKEQKIKQLEQKSKEIKAEIDRAKKERKEIEESVEYALQGLRQKIDLWAKTPRKFASEAAFLTAFKQYLNAKGLVFPERVINAFHTSLKVQDISALVILAGISGTGKSELPQAYADFIGAPLVMLPVQPRWDSPQDLQGFYNYIEKKYKPTDLMRYLYQHQHQASLRGRIVLVLLDEMNLARVEYYFSDFLSKLETRRNKKTYLQIDVNIANLKDEEKNIIIPNEFLFVGTMNEDETTQSLSDKVLDRANVLTFGRPPELKLRGRRQEFISLPTEYLSWEDFQDWTTEPSDHLMSQVKDYVDRANEIMEAFGRPFAHRVFQAFTKYVCNYPNAEQDEVVMKQAIADQFGQKILPKLRGVMVDETEVRENLDKMQFLLAELGDEALNAAFEKARIGQYGQFQWKGMVYSQD
jgi:hypothetical protein